MHVVRWQAEGGRGLEHLVLEWRHDRIRVDSVVIGQRMGALYGLRYALECDAQWAVRHASLDLVGGAALQLYSDGAGHWRNGLGADLPQLDGCLDLDIAATPFTHTLPLQRVKPTDHAPHFIRVAHISVPDFELRAVEYAYTCVTPGVEYTCQGTFRDATVSLKVDEDGIVLDYPPLYKRTR
jgi:hypothetical protein